MGTFSLVANQLERQQEEIAELRVDLNSTVEIVNVMSSRLAYLEDLNDTLDTAQKDEQLDLPIPPH